MRKLLLLFLFSPLVLMAQNKFGYFSYKAVLDSVPQYAVAMESYDKLKQRCLKEIDHNEQELTRFYVAFLDGQHDFPEPILRKRQKELQQLIDNSIIFRNELKAWLRHAKDSLSAASYQLIDSVLPRVCEELSLSYILDIDKGGYKYINPMFGDDVTADVISVILRPEQPLREIVECVEIATDSIACDEISTLPATELVIPATEIENQATEIPVEEAKEVEIIAVDQELEIVGVEKTELDFFNANVEVTDSINNK